MPASFASRPWGRWIARELGLASPSERVRVIAKGEKAPARRLTVPACSFGAKPPLPQPVVICIAASPSAAGRPDQGKKA
jgi:hypothetical protein